MERDLREIFREERETKNFTLNQGHEARFLTRLEKELPTTRKRHFPLLKIAASLLVLISTAGIAYTLFDINGEAGKETIVEVEKATPEPTGISLGDLSPDLKKIENYYVANINLQLSKLEVPENSKALVGNYMDRLSDLNLEYKRLNTELNRIGPNDQTITALIKNLQLRLELLHKMKEKLNELKSSKNEPDTTII